MPPAVVQSISVSYEYPVYFTRDVFEPDNLALIEAISAQEPARRHRVVPVIDRGLLEAWPNLLERVMGYARAHADRMALACEPIAMEGGEAAKNAPSLVADLQQRLDALGIDRQSFVLAVGGGAALDMIGFAAATAHRGVRLVRVPTTVLGQADSGVGVKNAINAFGKKNFLGTFAPPFAVLIDALFLSTLGRRDTVAGMSEAVKVALIRDADFFGWLEHERERLARCDAPLVEQLVRRCAELHLRHIATSGDPFEMGSARPLDFGHWAAHKLEGLTEHRLRHGEAVAIGIALDSHYSALMGVCDASIPARVDALLCDLGFRLWDDALETRGPDGEPVLLSGLDEFREHLGGELTITLLAAIGRGVEVHDMDKATILRALGELRTLNPAGTPRTPGGRAAS